MNPKSFRVSKDGTLYREVPGSSADITTDLSSADDSVFGTTFTSQQPTLATWNMSSNGFYKGFPGYKATLKRAGTPTATTGEALAVDPEDSLMYRVVDRTRSLWAYEEGVAVYDGATVVDEADIDYVDFLQGAVKFASTYTVTDDITVDVSYRSLSPICFAQSFTLTQSADTENTTDFCQAQDNGGFAVFSYQQQSVELSLEGFYSDTSGFFADLMARDQVIIEINPDGEGKSVARGYFRAANHSQSGDTGSTETESISWNLSVPEGVRYPFSWYHAEDSSIPNAVKWVLEAWIGREELYVQYRAENSGFIKSGKVLVGDTSLSGAVEEINDFSFDFQGSGELEETAA